jgi:malectin (di-glucose binding ER protein)
MAYNGGGFVRQILRIVWVSLLALLPAGVLAQQPLRVNCGGGSYTDSKGQIWQADSGYTGGSMENRTANFTGTSDPTLLATFRLNPTNYSFALPNGQYRVNLYFAEANGNALKVGARVFNVSLQGTLVFKNVDIFATVGAYAQLVDGADATVSNGVLTIGFTPVSGLNPKVNAIEILPVTSASFPTLTLNFKYSDGTPVSGNLNYAVTSSLLSFQGSAALVNGQAQCLLLSNPSALGISAQFSVNLNLTDTAGHQLWQVNLGMNPSGVNLGAVQNSTLNVVVQRQ